METLSFYLKLLFSFKEIHWIPRKGDMRECTPYTLSFDGSGSSISGVSVNTLAIAYDVSLFNISSTSNTIYFIDNEHLSKNR